MLKDMTREHPAIRELLVHPTCALQVKAGKARIYGSNPREQLITSSCTQANENSIDSAYRSSESEKCESSSPQPTKHPRVPKYDLKPDIAVTSYMAPTYMVKANI